MTDLLQPLQPLFASAFSLGGSPVTWLELVALVLALWMVGCNMRVKPLAWPLAIASSLLYGALFWHSGLYGEASLQLFFVVMAGWGWWQWLRGTESSGTQLRVRALGRRGRSLALLAWLLSWPLLALFLQRFTDSDVPWWDALPTAGSVIGQWLLARKYVENWPTWALVNAVSLALFAHKGLWLTSGLYLLFLLLSFAGWRVWRQQAAVAATTR